MILVFRVNINAAFLMFNIVLLTSENLKSSAVDEPDEPNHGATMSFCIQGLESFAKEFTTAVNKKAKSRGKFMFARVIEYTLTNINLRKSAS